MSLFLLSTHPNKQNTLSAVGEAQNTKRSLSVLMDNKAYCTDSSGSPFNTVSSTEVHLTTLPKPQEPQAEASTCLSLSRRKKETWTSPRTPLCSWSYTCLLVTAQVAGRPPQVRQQIYTFKHLDTWSDEHGINSSRQIYTRILRNCSDCFPFERNGKNKNTGNRFVPAETHFLLLSSCPSAVAGAGILRMVLALGAGLTARQQGLPFRATRGPGLDINAGKQSVCSAPSTSRPKATSSQQQLWRRARLIQNKEKICEMWSVTTA